MKKTLTLMLMDPPYESSNTMTAFRMIEAALDRGHDVNVFAFEGAVALSLAGQRAHPNPVHGTDAEEEKHPLTRDFVAGLFDKAKESGGKLDWGELRVLRGRAWGRRLGGGSPQGWPARFLQDAPGCRHHRPSSPPARRKPCRRFSAILDSAYRASLEEQDDAEEQPEQVRTRVRNMLSVHALGQYVFCPRAAILAAERGDERDIDEPPPRLTFLPNFDLERIEELLSKSLKQLLLAVVLIFGLMVSMTLSSQDQNPTQFNLAAATFFFALLWTAHLVTSIVQLTIRRIAALRAEAREPEPTFVRTEPVNWWSILNAGFEPIRYQRPFQHPELPLEGCPWRVLQKESLRIPVIKTGGDRLGNGKGQLFPKHEVRITAYALLLEADGHMKVPYGLVFPADSPRGMAFAITDNHRRQAVQLLAEFEQKLNDSQQRDIHPGLPENRNRCANCDFGKPIATSLREVASARKAGEQIVVLQGRTDDVFHCECGDRFGSAPPHRDSVRKGLRAVLE